MPEHELEIALQDSRAAGLRLWERTRHLTHAMKEIMRLTNDPLITQLAQEALTYKSNTPI